jgi:hypothetical protein
LCLQGIASYNAAYGNSDESLWPLRRRSGDHCHRQAFLPQVLADPLLAPYFDDVDMDRQVAKQAAFLTMALDGPDRYTGRDPRTAHAGLAGLTDEHVDRVIGHLAQTLRELGVAEDDIAAAGPSRPVPGTR